MKAVRMLAACGAIVSFVVGISFAHAPSSVTVQYDAASVTLTIEVVHQVRDEGHHFVEEIRVLKNGKQIALQNFSRQADKTKQLATYTVPGLKKGDEISVSGGCNYGGSKTGTIKIQ